MKRALTTKDTKIYEGKAEKREDLRRHDQIVKEDAKKMSKQRGTNTCGFGGDDGGLKAEEKIHHKDILRCARDRLRNPKEKHFWEMNKGRRTPPVPCPVREPRLSSRAGTGTGARDAGLHQPIVCFEDQSNNKRIPSNPVFYSRASSLLRHQVAEMLRVGIVFLQNKRNPRLESRVDLGTGTGTSSRK